MDTPNSNNIPNPPPSQSSAPSLPSLPRPLLSQPFLPPSSPLQLLFPAREWAVRIPAILMLSGLCAIGAFVGLVLIKSRAKRGRLGPSARRRPVARARGGAGGGAGRVKIE